MRNTSGVANAFDLHRAYSLALASELAYSEPDTIERTVVHQWGFQRFYFYDVDETQCFVAASSDAIIVAFRGTETDEIGDWISDIDFGLIDGPLGGKVHEGFYESLSNVWRLVDRQVSVLHENPSTTLWVTGHSMGAALATLAVARWRERSRGIDGLYGFGQPRIGDRSFSLHFDFDFKPRAFRIVNNHDIVSRVPPRVFGYRHTGTFKYFNEPGELLDQIHWWRTFLRGWQGSVEDVLEWCADGVRDHSMTVYRQRIENALRQTYDLQAFGDLNTVQGMPVETPDHWIQPRRRAA